MKNLKAILNSGLACILLCVSLLWGCSQGQDQVIVFSEANSELMEFVLNEIRMACLEKRLQYLKAMKNRQMLFSESIPEIQI